MTTQWQRPSQNQAQSRYHATTNGTPTCGARVRDGTGRIDPDAFESEPWEPRT